jgi:hypothetical protein
MVDGGWWMVDGDFVGRASPLGASSILLSGKGVTALFLAKPSRQLTILMFEIGDHPPTTGSKTQQETGGEEVSTTDNTDDGGCGDKIEHGSFSSRLLKLFENHLI